LSEYELNKIVKKILSEQAQTPRTPSQTPGSQSPRSQSPRSQSPRTPSQTPGSNPIRQTSQTPGPQMPASQRRPLPTPFNPQHKGTFEVDCKAGLSKLGYPGKLSKEGNKLFVELFCNPKYRNR
jgi:hypothetical protein